MISQSFSGLTDQDSVTVRTNSWIKAEQVVLKVQQECFIFLT